MVTSCFGVSHLKLCQKNWIHRENCVNPYQQIAFHKNPSTLAPLAFLPALCSEKRFFPFNWTPSKQIDEDEVNILKNPKKIAKKNKKKKIFWNSVMLHSFRFTLFLSLRHENPLTTNTIFPLFKLCNPRVEPYGVTMADPQGKPMRQTFHFFPLPKTLIQFCLHSPFKF